MKIAYTTYNEQTRPELIPEGYPNAYSEVPDNYTPLEGETLATLEEFNSFLGTFNLEDYLESESTEQRIKSLKERGSIFAQCCEAVLALVAGYNDDRDLTAEQLSSLFSTFSTIDFYLSKNMPKSARALIMAMTPDGVLVTSQMKSDILLEFSKYPID